MDQAALHIQYCYHCGDQMGEAKYETDGHKFCCLGCKGAYQVIAANNLCDYYGIESNPGNSLNQEVDPTEFAYLDEESIKKKLLDFSDGQTARVSLKLPQIHCSSCIWLLENLQKINHGILASRVNFSKKTIHITFSEEKVSLRQVVELLSGFGYLPEINLNTSAKKAGKEKNNKKIYYQLGVAGFCFGNIMLMSFPEYIGIAGDFHKQFSGLFRWLNAALSIPVLFYSASDYLQNALNAVKTRVLNLDVPIVLGMAALFGRSMYEVIAGVGQGYFDSLVGFVFFLLLGKLFQAKTYNHLSFERDFKSFFPLAVDRKHEDEIRPIAINELEVADIIVIKSGQIVPCDSILLNGDAQIDYSFVTGESVPVQVNVGSVVYAGGKQIGASIELLVEKKVQDSYLTELWRDNKGGASSELGRVADKVGKYFTLSVLAIAVFTLSYWMFFDVSKAFLAFTSVLIVACPCALALSIPFTQGTAMRWLSRAGFFMKHSSVLEKMAGINHLVFDKTGTLTTRKSEVIYHGEPIDNHIAAIYSLVCQSGHPLSLQLVRYFEKNYRVDLLGVDEFRETKGQGLEGRVANVQIKLGSAGFLKLSKENNRSTQVHLQIDGDYYGAFKIKVAYRTGLQKLVSDLRQYRLSLMSGDNDGEREYLSGVFGNGILFFNQSPHDKEEVIRGLRKEGEKVAMIGDGLNDAGALLESNLGISVTDDENNFTPASDAIIKGDSLARMPRFLHFSKVSMQIVYVAFAISFAYNLIGLSFAVQGVLSPVVSAILMPLSSITVVVFTTLITSLWAKKLQLV